MVEQAMLNVIWMTGLNRISSEDHTSLWIKLQEINFYNGYGLNVECHIHVLAASSSPSPCACTWTAVRVELIRVQHSHTVA
jgi:hypothetical protein